MAGTKEGIAIAELVVYIPSLILAIVIVIRLGFHRQLGWIYLAILSGIRIAGAVFELLREHDPSNSTYIEWAAILQSIGLAPLILASMGLLKRVIDETSDREPSDPLSTGNVLLEALSFKFGIIKRIASKATAVARRSRLIQVLQLPSTIGLILCIVGGIDEGSSDPSDQQEGPGLFKAGIIIFVILYAILLALVAGSISEWRKTPPEERRILLAVVFALPLLGCRILWSILSVFVTSSDNFNSMGGNVWIQAFMATLEEFLIVVMYLAVGFMVHRYGHHDAPMRVVCTKDERPVSLEPFLPANSWNSPPQSDGPVRTHQGGQYHPPPRSTDESTKIAAYYAAQQGRHS